MAGKGILPARRKSHGEPIDLQRWQSAMRGPGMDTRLWVAHGVVTTAAYFDKASGLYFAGVQLQPSLIDVDCRLVGFYAGNGISVMAPVAIDDEVLVEIPEGNPNAGCSIIGRPNNPANPPPPGWDFKSLVIYNQGTGIPIRIISDKVTLGLHPSITTDPADSAILGDTYRNAEANENSTLVTQLQLMATAFTAQATASTGTLMPLQTGFTTLATIATALANAIQGFESGASGYLSGSLKVGK